jgi:L-rhamnose mutarotase
MKRNAAVSVIVLLAVLIVFIAGCAKPEVKRVGMVIGIDPQYIPEYKKLHADDSPGVRDLLTKYNMRNFSIYLHEIDGKWYEFGYYEYVGDDFEADMAKLDAEPRNKAWLEICDPMQVPLKGEKSWAVMEEVYHND